ncbi:DUF3117 domain-containing protein [Nonomuraea rubra]|uniref:DUF3117 domain-containing protein n=1 Tax=Nonomuraea rubra TaxID=46180 RepID=UPI003CD0888F
MRRPPLGRSEIAGAGAQGRKGCTHGGDEARNGDGPLEVTKEGARHCHAGPPGGWRRLVVEISADEAKALGEALKNVVG